MSERTLQAVSLYCAPSVVAGYGLYAGRAFGAGELMFSLRGRLFGGNKRGVDDDWFAHSYQLEQDLYLYPETPEGRYINHSCDPNAGLRDDLEMVALRDIQAGEEVFFDYSTTMSERSWTMPCRCGSQLCRGEISDFHDLPLAAKRRYLEAGVVQRFIIREVFERAISSMSSREVSSARWASLAAGIVTLAPHRPWPVLGESLLGEPALTGPSRLRPPETVAVGGMRSCG